MIVDEETGEILERRYDSLPYKHEEEPKKRVVEFLRDCKDKYEVINLYRKGEHKHKLLFTNYSVDYLMNTTLNKEQMQKFYKLCEMIVVRNVILEETKDIADHLNVSYKNLSKLMKVFEDNHMIDYYKKNVMKRGRHIILVNPTIVWRSYLHKQGWDYETRRPYCHNTFFSKAHKNNVEYWTERMVEKYANHGKENTNNETHEEQAIRFGYDSLEDFDKWVNKAKKELKLDGEDKIYKDYWW